ncbi:ribosome recycling factor [candidate division TA06 bacterium]|uniref:Ribosome-recycling factor n=1 Tax=candidate division TA06 bacterium TaxID=2250710 RepID=A0A660SGI7_UNCT6|nr:MAG: ribosome recycling factor [candidate division TA06 bacterium]
MNKEAIKLAKERMQKSIESLKHEFNKVRSGRPKIGLFEDIQVNYYGNLTPLNQVANISIPDATLVIIQPWDKSQLESIEKAIQVANIGFNPSNDGKAIRINIPSLSEERRIENSKTVKRMGEEEKIDIRNIRRDSTEDIKELQKNGNIAEDQRDLDLEEIQKITDNYVEKTEKMVNDKIKEVMEV